jgi:hypothetical protein
LKLGPKKPAQNGHRPKQNSQIEWQASGDNQPDFKPGTSVERETKSIEKVQSILRPSSAAKPNNFNGNHTNPTLVQSRLALGSRNSKSSQRKASEPNGMKKFQDFRTTTSINKQSSLLSIAGDVTRAIRDKYDQNHQTDSTRNHELESYKQNREKVSKIYANFVKGKKIPDVTLGSRNNSANNSTDKGERFRVGLSEFDSQKNFNLTMNYKNSDAAIHCEPKPSFSSLAYEKSPGLTNLGLNFDGKKSPVRGREARGDHREANDQSKDL